MERKRVERMPDGTTNAEALAADEVALERVLCPACHKQPLDKWPLGWDGHSGWRCEAIEGATPAERKANYKHRFRHLFR
jgi:hypothetical protein